MPTVTLMNPIPKIKTFTKSKDLMQNAIPLFNITHTPHPTIKLRRIQITQALESYRFCRNTGNDANCKGWGVILVAS